ncbi:MAG TPA: serine protease, partial [Nitrospiraceae bacterium]|nr:serine protease [Nitrospiraceae bacterium]
MGTVSGRDGKARTDVIIAAGRRWLHRQEARQEGLGRIAREGPGAADTPKRRREFATRQAARARRIVGPTQDLVMLSPSTQASRAASPVARIVTLPDGDRSPQGVATGFLVSEGLLLTNHHVFPLRSDCRGYGANFNHYFDERGLNEGSVFELDPDLFFLSDEHLDFALVGVRSQGRNAENLISFGRVRLIEATGKILTGLPVNIIQHPGGGPRQYGITNNRLVDILEEGFLHYETDTDKGSSGSPVFNQDWELLGLHHSGVPDMKGDVILKTDGTPWDPENDSEEAIHWIANEGTRVSSLVKCLKEAKLASAAEELLLGKLLETTSDPVMAAGPSIDPTLTAAGSEGGAVSQNIFNISGNVTIHVYGGASMPSGLVAFEKGGGAEAASGA